MTVGPGLKGILKGSSLPASGKPATPENIALQLKKPLGKMPSFAHMTDEEVANLLAYLKTL
ncbi:MAG: cytochrome c [Desulfomicrobium escambiense]|nr:cytochrome c [Desulfomicrobium escambiense]